jgi:uncharacterized protein (DUF362 family)
MDPDRWLEQRISRRRVLQVAGFAVVGGTLAAECRGEGEQAVPVPSPTPGPTARVAAIRGSDLYAMAREALEAVGGTQAVVSPGETVFIKPNMVTLPWAHLGRNPFAMGECTKPEIVIAVAEECLRAGAAEVIVGDGSQMPRFSWEYATTLDGSTNLAAEAARLSSKYGGKVTLACLDADSPEWVEVPSRTDLRRIAVSGLVARADRVISIPVIKTHQWAQVTLSLKNFVGVTPLARYVVQIALRVGMF